MAADLSVIFGNFVLYANQRQLTENGVPVPLGARAIDILLYLVQHHSEIVSKSELLAVVWRDRVVEENNLTVDISALRRALGDGRDGARFIQTIPGRGYCFVAAVTMQATPAQPLPSHPGQTPNEAHNLPSQITRFIGREADMTEIRQRLQRHRLVTITGVGGIGKTRLAVQVGREICSVYPDGVWLVDLATVTDPDRLIQAVAVVLKIGGTREDTIDLLSEFLKSRTILLILDNCEHLIRRAAAMTRSILDACPGVSVLATGRESLAIAGESLYRMPPLPFPPESESLNAAAALRHDSVRLFVDRAATAIDGFVLDDATAPDVARICQRLDGIALAIEMAVPRLRVMSPAQLADRLNERFRLLTGHDRGALPRHRTLRAVIDWSYELLSDSERALLCRLSVFAGGANFEAMVAVTADGIVDDWDVLDPLTALIDKSMVITEVTGLEPRYRLLETTRQYAAEKLLATDEVLSRRRHAMHFAEVFTRAEAEWPTAVSADWLKTYGPDVDNLRTALDWAFGPHGDIPLGLRLVACSYPLWWDLPQLALRESRRWFDRAMPHITLDTPPAIAARLWFGMSWRDVRFGDRENFAAAARAVELYRETGEPLGLGAALWRAGSALLTAETAGEARAYFDEAERVLRSQPPTNWFALCLVKQGDLRFRLGDLDQALADYEEAMWITRSTGNWYGLMNGGSNMAELLYHLGQRERALDQLRNLRGELGEGRSTPLVATMAAHLLLAGQAEEARAAVREVVTFAGAIGLPGSLGWAAEVLALLLADEGGLSQAARFAGYARFVHPSTSTRAGSRRDVFLRLDATLSERLTPAARERLMAEGAIWSEPRAAQEALAASDPRRSAKN